MRNKIGILLSMLCLVFCCHAESQATADSIKAAQINKEAENPDFVHAYILDISAGKAFYSTFGHEAIRLVCPSKNLDYCFSFEMDMNKSSNIDVFRRTAKAGFCMVPSQEFIASYKKEGRGVTAYELNLTPKEKQELWKFLDYSINGGANWTFDYLSVNCLSMVFYAINSAIMPNQIVLKHLPSITRTDFVSWKNYITRNSPWINLLFKVTLPEKEGERMQPEDKLIPEMQKTVLPQAIIVDSIGKFERQLIKGKPVVLSPNVYQDKPCWFKPWMAVTFLLFLISGTFAIVLNKKKHNNQ